MKRIILGLSLVLMLVQNGFAKTDAYWDKKIANTQNNVWKQIYRCNKAMENHSSTADVNICLKSIDMQKEQGIQDKDLNIDYLNVGVIYSHHGDKLNAYKYYMKAAKLGNIQAQKNLSIICNNNPWVCK